MRRNPALLTVLATLLTIAACSPGPTPTLAPNTDLHPELGKPFDLRIGDSAFIDAVGYRIDVKGVPSDSRCPDEGECLQPDVAIVAIEVRETAASEPRPHQIFFDPGTSVTTIGGYDIQVLELRPPFDEVRGPADYVVTLLVTRTQPDLILDPRMTSTSGSVRTGGEVTFTASADGSGLAQYTLTANEAVIGISRYDGTLVRGSQSPVIELVSWTADAQQATWTVRMLNTGRFTMTASVSGEVPIGGGAFAFAHGAASAQLTVE